MSRRDFSAVGSSGVKSLAQRRLSSASSSSTNQPLCSCTLSLRLSAFSNCVAWAKPCPFAAERKSAAVACNSATSRPISRMSAVRTLSIPPTSACRKPSRTPKKQASAVTRTRPTFQIISRTRNDLDAVRARCASLRESLEEWGRHRNHARCDRIIPGAVSFRTSRRPGQIALGSAARNT